MLHALGEVVSPFLGLWVIWYPASTTYHPAVCMMHSMWCTCCNTTQVAGKAFRRLAATTCSVYTVLLGVWYTLPTMPQVGCVGDIGLLTGHLMTTRVHIHLHSITPYGEWYMTRARTVHA